MLWSVQRRDISVAPVWKGTIDAGVVFAGTGGITIAEPCARTAAEDVVSGAPARRARGCFLPCSKASAWAAVTQSPSLVIPMGTTSYLVWSIALRTEAAESREISCSPERPPKRTPTRSFFTGSSFQMQKQ